MIRRWSIRIVALSSIVVCLLISIVDAVRGFPSEGFYLLYGSVALVFVAVGWLIAERRPGNAVGPLLLTFGALFSWYLPADLYLRLPGDLPGQDLAALAVSALDAPMFILIALALILFPDGTVPSPRWRWVVPLGVIGIGLTIVGHALSGEPYPLFPSLESPVGIDGFPGLPLVFAAYVIMVSLLFAAAASLILRWRRGDVVERTKIKWVVAAAVVMLVTELINVVTFRADAPNTLTNVLANLGIALIPLSMGIAILRYGLYDIDRIISRSVGYAVVTGILAIVFGAVVVLLSTVLSQLAQGQTIAVAASTLAVFALFQPVRRRVQQVVDRRFDRSRYDAERTATAFAERLLHEVDMETVTTDLARTAGATVAPRSLSIWLRAPGAGR